MLFHARKGQRKWTSKNRQEDIDRLSRITTLRTKTETGIIDDYERPVV